MPTTQEVLTQVTAGAIIAEGLYSALFDRMLFDFIAFDFASDTGVGHQTSPSATATKESITTTTG